MTEPAPLRGLTWDHPRATEPLAAFDATGAGPRVHWTRQSLESFEAHPIADAACDHDLLVVDHPGLGAAVAAGALRPLEELIGDDTLGAWRAETVAGTWDSYRLDGRQWAVPVDAATQVVVARREVADAVPQAWEELPALARTMPTTLCLGGPHALLGLLAMCASASFASALGRTAVHGTTSPDGALLDVDLAADAVDLLREVHLLGDRRLALGNPIAVHDALADGSGPALCPLVYGYASYARPRPGTTALSWADAPSFRGGPPGSVLGGTGVAVSARHVVDPALVRDWLTAYLRPAVQTGLACEHAGQPASRSTWDSLTVDQAWGGYYSSTRRSLDAAHLRPRVAGWIPLQDAASAAVRELVTSGGAARPVLAHINDRYRALRATTRAGAR